MNCIVQSLKTSEQIGKTSFSRDTLVIRLETKFESINRVTHATVNFIKYTLKLANSDYSKKR